MVGGVLTYLGTPSLCAPRSNFVNDTDVNDIVIIDANRILTGVLARRYQFLPQPECDQPTAVDNGHQNQQIAVRSQ